MYYKFRKGKFWDCATVAFSERCIQLSHDNEIKKKYIYNKRNMQKNKTECTTTDILVGYIH